MSRFHTLVPIAICAVALLTTANANAGDVEDALQAYWNFDSFDESTAWPGGVPHAANFMAGTTGIFDDVSANSNVLYAGNSKQATDPYQSSAGKFGGAFYAENAGDNSAGAAAIALHSSQINFGDENFTVSLWQKSTQYRGNGDWGTQKHRGVMIAKFKDEAPDGDGTGWRFGLETGNYGLKRDGTRGSNTDILSYTNNGDAILQNGDPGNDGFFAHYLFTYDASADTLRIYENGVLQAEDTNFDSTDAAALSSDSALSFGAALDDGISTSGSFGFQGMLSGLSNTGNPAWIDDAAILKTNFSPGEVVGTFNLGHNSGLGYDLGDVIKLLDVHRDGAGSTTVDGLTWSYATSLSGTDGQLTGSGSNYTLVLDSAGGTGLVSSGSTVIPAPAALPAGLTLIALAGLRRRPCA